MIRMMISALLILIGAVLVTHGIFLVAQHAEESSPYVVAFFEFLLAAVFLAAVVLMLRPRHGGS
jgi:drug/metabolite transporter (DMT)-like permease